MGRLGLKDKHLAEDDQWCLGEAAGLDDQSLIKLVNRSNNLRSFIYLISTSPIVQVKAKGIVAKPLQDLAKDEVHHQAATFAATHPDTIHHLATSVEPIIHAAAPIADALPHVGVFTKGWKFIKGTSKAAKKQQRYVFVENPTSKRVRF